MKVWLSTGLMIVVIGVGIAGADRTWTGQISDSMCGAKHMDAQGGKKKMSDRDCAQVCAAKGAQYVLVSDGKIYKLTNHDADLKAHAGHTVNLTGDLNGETIKVSKIEMSAGDKK